MKNKFILGKFEGTKEYYYFYNFGKFYARISPYRSILNKEMCVDQIDYIKEYYEE